MLRPLVRFTPKKVQPFQLVPVTRGFWHGGQWYDVFPVRHHWPDTAFGLRLPGSVVWTGFAFSMALTAWGLWRMDVNPTYKAYLGVSWLFLISTVFTLAKTLRDAHEADVLEARLGLRAALREPGETFRGLRL